MSGTSKAFWRHADEQDLQAGFVVESNSPLIDKLEAANGIVLGKTRMHELAEGVSL